MDWIESHVALATHPKTKRLARSLGVSKPAVIGHLHLLWGWAARHALDGDLSKFDPFDIAEAAEWDGDPDDFVKALIACGPRDSAGFLDDNLGLHDWARYTEKYRAASTDGKRGAHVKWHTSGKSTPSPDCQYCINEGLVSVPTVDDQAALDISQDHDSVRSRQAMNDTTTPHQNPSSDGVPIAPDKPPNATLIAGPDLTRPDPTLPDRTKPSSPPAPPSPTRPAGQSATRDDDDDSATPNPKPLTGHHRATLVDTTGRTWPNPTAYTLECLTHAVRQPDPWTDCALILADHLAEHTNHPVGTGAVHELRALVQQHPPDQILQTLHDAIGRSDVKRHIAWTRTTLTNQANTR